MMTKADEDHELVRRTAHGDFVAFEQLIRRHQHSVINLAFRFLGDAAEAEDVAQEAFIRVFENAGKYREQAAFKTWLFTIVKRRCIDRSRKRRPELLDDSTGVPDTYLLDRQMERNEISQQVQDALASLPESQRIALVLQHFEDMSYAEVAATMGVSVSSVESLLVRAKRTLRKRLAGLTSLP